MHLKDAYDLVWKFQEYDEAVALLQQALEIQQAYLGKQHDSSSSSSSSSSGSGSDSKQVGYTHNFLASALWMQGQQQQQQDQGGEQQQQQPQWNKQQHQQWNKQQQQQRNKQQQQQQRYYHQALTHFGKARFIFYKFNKNKSASSKSKSKSKGSKQQQQQQVEAIDERITCVLIKLGFTDQAVEDYHETLHALMEHELVGDRFYETGDPVRAKVEYHKAKRLSLALQNILLFVASAGRQRSC
jgi:hypothetical protein